MIKKFTIGSLLMSFCYCFAYAQEDTVSMYRHDLGFNTTFILQGIFNSSETPFSLMYKTYKKEGKATRYGLEVSFNLDDNKPENNSSYYTNTSSGSFDFVFGKENQNHITNTRWVWFYGGDLIAFYRFSTFDSYQNNELYDENEFKSYGIGIRPFLGIRYNINERLYISAEASLRLNYARRENFVKNVNQAEAYRDTKGDNVSFSLQPASGIFLFYRF